MTDVVLEAAVVPCIWDNKEQIYVPVYSHRGVEIKDRIEQLEAALREIAAGYETEWSTSTLVNALDVAQVLSQRIQIARAALGEKKDER